jgi:hypothetical protein
MANVERFAVDMSEIRTLMRDRVDEAFRHVALRVTENIIVGGPYSPGTPKDTGFARNSWTVGINTMGEDRQPSTREGDAKKQPVDVGSLDVAQLAILGARASEGDVIYLTSNCVYMRRLEYGHSKQAPQGMVRLTMQNAQRIVEDVEGEMAPIGSQQ